MVDDDDLGNLCLGVSDRDDHPAGGEEEAEGRSVLARPGPARHGAGRRRQAADGVHVLPGILLHQVRTIAATTG